MHKFLKSWPTQVSSFLSNKDHLAGESCWVGHALGHLEAGGCLFGAHRCVFLRTFLRPRPPHPLSSSPPYSGRQWAGNVEEVVKLPASG